MITAVAGNCKPATDESRNVGKEDEAGWGRCGDGEGWRVQRKALERRGHERGEESNAVRTGGGLKTQSCRWKGM